MTGTVAGLRELVLATIRDPRGTARRLLAMGLSFEARWLGFALVVVLSLLASQALVLGLAVDPANPFEAMMQNPVSGAMMQAILVLGIAAGISGGARLFGGTGRFDDALLLASWAEFVMLCAQLAMTLLLLVLPVLAPLGMLAMVGLFFWIITSFTMELNGFRSFPKTFLGVFMMLMLAGFVLLTLFASLGIVPTLPEA